MNDLARAIASGLAGVAIGWAAQALTLNGRVAALEAGMSRIESRLDQLLKAAKP